MVARNKKETGKIGERIAKEFLLRKGYRLIAENFACRLGEIDLIFQHGPHVIFVEVRTRRTLRYGTAQESVDGRKREKLRKVAAYFLSQRSWHHRPVRFDVVSVRLIDGECPQVEHLEGAF
ncbi:YraN family protein [Bacillaceae bacterium]